MRKQIHRVALALALLVTGVPAVHGSDDPTVWRPLTGLWYSAPPPGGVAATGTSGIQWGSGATGDVPLMGDVDGDGIRDLVVWRTSTGVWFALTSSSGFSTTAALTRQFGSGAAGDIPLLADIDGDGKADFTVWRPSIGTFFWLTSSSRYMTSGLRQWGSGALGDVPLTGDFDGDGRSDLAVWRASTGTWYWLTAASGFAYPSAGSRQWGSGAHGDVPKVADIDGDGKDDLLVWRGPTGVWFWLTSSSGYSYAASGMRQWGSQGMGDVPLVGDFDRDGRADLTVYRPSTGTWFSLTAVSGYSYAGSLVRQLGAGLDVPVVARLFRNNGTNPTPAPAPAPAPTPTSSSSELRVLQWNLHHGGFGTDGVYDTNRVATWVATMRPDVILFNEIEKFTSWGNQDQPEVYKALLQQKTGKTWYYVFAQEYGDWTSKGKGNAIFSTFPIIDVDRYELAHNGDRSIALAGITVNGRRITLISTHLDPDSQSLRLTQATEVTGWSAAQPENRIIAGDMNAWPDQSSIAHFNTLYNDSWSVAVSKGTATSFAGNDGQTKNGRIDYIFYSKSSSNLTTKSSQVYDTRDSSGVMPSDHRPVLTTFVVR